MSENVLEKLFEHNNWANLELVRVCAALSDEQLDAEPDSATRGSIRLTLLHLVTSQQGYLALLTQPAAARRRVPPAFEELETAVTASGDGLLALVRDLSDDALNTRLQTQDGYFVAPWVVLLQVINHATEHREQIKSMLTALGVTPPNLDGWRYGEVTKDLIPITPG